MTNKNQQIKPGYQLSKIGLIPTDWEVKKLKNVLSEARLGGNYANTEEKTLYPLIKMGNIGRGKITLNKIEYIPQTETPDENDVLKKGDILFNTRNTLELVGKVAIWNNELPRAFYNSNLLRLKFVEEFVASNYFMNYNLNSSNSIRQLRGYATGTTSVAAIYSRDLANLKIPLPPLPEQQKIAEILSSWDDAISKTQAVIKKLKKRNKGLAQQLLTGKKRLPGFNGVWKHLRIKDIANQLNILNKDNQVTEVLSCTKHKGLVRSLDYFGRQVFGDDLTKYKVVPLHTFVYATNHIEEGSIGYQNLLDTGLVSPMYTVFKTKEIINNGFLFKLLKSEKLIYEYQSNMSGSINRRGGLRWDDFSKIRLHIPSSEEQHAIAKFLDQSNYEQKCYEQKLAALQLQKKGLMQKLLTGEIRVKTN